MIPNGFVRRLPYNTGIEQVLTHVWVLLVRTEDEYGFLFS